VVLANKLCRMEGDGKQIALQLKAFWWESGKTVQG
jgi:hypothetical protein